MAGKNKVELRGSEVRIAEVQNISCIVHVFFFFSSRRRHTRLQGDWSSDVCSSDLDDPQRHLLILGGGTAGEGGRDPYRHADHAEVPPAYPALPQQRGQDALGGAVHRDRKSVVQGKSVDLGGRRIIKKKKHKDMSEE